jgi:hypothetical protein
MHKSFDETSLTRRRFQIHRHLSQIQAQIIIYVGRRPQVNDRWRFNTQLK